MPTLKVFNLELANRGVLRAVCSVDHGNGLITHHWRVLSRDGALEVAPPQIRAGNEHLDVLEFADPSELDRFRATVMDAYRQKTE